ncbi:MAG: 16S rRNA processing protein RimM [Hymenobacteraceae bacterium]|nr:16S rRNA processing protein RimM [Hymenobacteraceae bacterium]
MVQTDDFFALGTIIRPHGVRGQVVVELDTDQPAAYKKLQRAQLQRPNAKALAPVEIEKVQLTAGAGAPRALFSLVGITTVEAAEELRGATLWLPLTELPPLTGAGQFYYHEVVGFTVVDAAAGELGPVTTFYELPQHDVLAVEHRGFEVLVPVNDTVIQTVDRAARTLYVTLPDGLLDLYTEEVKPKVPRTRKGGPQPPEAGGPQPPNA